VGFCDGQKRCWDRFSPRTSVSPALPIEGTSRNERESTIKPHTVEEYNHHTGFVDMGNRIANSYSMSHCIWNWMKKLIFRLLDMAILNSMKVWFPLDIIISINGNVVLNV
jgi:hypothetical protein